MPTKKQITYVESAYNYFDEKHENQQCEPIIGKLSKNGRDLLKDSEFFLSLKSHQNIVEKAFTDFYVYLADYVLTHKPE